MAFALLIIGVVLLVSGVRNTQSQLFTLVQGDFTGDSNFFFWFVSILLIGAIGYIPKLKPISTAFLVLVVLVLFLTKGNPGSSSGGFFQKFTAALGSTQNASTTNAGTPTGGQVASTLAQAKQQLQTIQNQLSQNITQSSILLGQDISQ